VARIKKVKKRVSPWVVVQDIPPSPDNSNPRPQRSLAHVKHRDAVATLTAWDAEKARGAGPFADAAAFTGGPAAASSTWTMAALLRHWLDDHAAPRVRPRSLYLYRTTVERHLIPALGAVPVRQLTPPRIQAFYTVARTGGMSDRSLIECHRRLNQALAMAERQGVIERNPVARVTAPTYRPKPQKAWSEEQARQFLAVACTPGASPYGPVWPVILTTGVRRGELMGLRWADVDLANGVIRITGAVIREDDHHLVAGGTKRPKSIRDLGIGPLVVDALRAHFIAQKEERLRLGGAAPGRARGNVYQENGLVFPSGAGTWIEPSNLRRDFLRLTAKAGLPPITIHSARHTYASVALAAGESVVAVSESLGHADVSVTLRTYAHVTAAQRAAVSARMGDRLMGGGDTDEPDNRTETERPGG